MQEEKDVPQMVTKGESQDEAVQVTRDQSVQVRGKKRGQIFSEKMKLIEYPLCFE